MHIMKGGGNYYNALLCQQAISSNKNAIKPKVSINNVSNDSLETNTNIYIF